MRVGALPQYHDQRAEVRNLTWSVDGLINEYVHPHSEAIVDGARIEQPPLEGYETFALDGVELRGVQHLGRAAARWPKPWPARCSISITRPSAIRGTATSPKLMLQDFGLAGKREVMKDILRTAIPTTEQGRGGRVRHGVGFEAGRAHAGVVRAEGLRANLGAAWPMTGIQITTASGVCAVLDLFMQGALRGRGSSGRSRWRSPTFLANRFGRALRSRGGSLKS